MTLFSDNPGLERMMQQKPAGRRCVGICYKKLMSERRKTA